MLWDYNDRLWKNLWGFRQQSIRGLFIKKKWYNLVIYSKFLKRESDAPNSRFLSACFKRGLLWYWGCQLSHTVTHSCGKVVYTYLSVPVQRHCGKTPSWPLRQPGPPPPVGKQGWAGGRCADPGCCSESPQPPGQTGTAEVSVDGCNKDLSINDGNDMGLRLTLEPFQRKYWGNFWEMGCRTIQIFPRA